MLHVTPESIARAKAAQDAERAAVTAATGATFQGDELILPHPTHPPIPRIVLSACLVHGCLYVAGGKSEGDALLKLERHLRTSHGVRAPREVA